MKNILSKLNVFRNLNLRRMIDRNQTFEKVVAYTFGLLGILGLVGYFLNIVKMVTVDWSAPATNEIFVRFFGIVTGLGALIGWF